MRRGLALFAFLLALAFGGLAWWGISMVRSIGSLVAGEPARPVYFIDEGATDAGLGDMAVLLHPQVTGGPPLLVRDTDALRANRMNAYVTDKSSAAEAVGTVVLAMMGGPNMQPVVTVFSGREARLSITCNMAQCQDGVWVDPEFSHDIGDLAEAGLPVDRRDETYYERAAYVEAHAAALADPEVYFADPDGATPLPEGDLRQSYRLLLPSRLVSSTAAPDRNDYQPNEEMRASLQSLGAQIDEATLNVDAQPFLTDANGFSLSGAHDGMRLEDIAVLTPNLVVSVPFDGAAALEAGLSALTVEGWDTNAEARAIATALEANGLPDCRPGCIIDASRANREISLSAFPAPSWRLVTWKVVTP